jgi:hypothetical protein
MLTICFVKSAYVQRFEQFKASSQDDTQILHIKWLSSLNQRQAEQAAGSRHDVQYQNQRYCMRTAAGNGTGLTFS